MAVWPGRPDELKAWQHDIAAWVEANDECRRDILELLRGDGPLPTSALPDTCQVPWRSTGWNNNQNVKRLLVQMVERGEVATAGRRGREQLWDLAERIYPDDPVPDVEEARRIRDERRLRSARPRPGHDARDGFARAQRRRRGRRARRRRGRQGGVAGRPGHLDGPFTGRTALLSPYDRLVYDRKRTEELFGFEYYLEMYKPAAKRRWGYYALPILHGDRLVGKLDATADRKAGVLRVDAIHEDVPFDATCGTPSTPRSRTSRGGWVWRSSTRDSARDSRSMESTTREYRTGDREVVLDLTRDCAEFVAGPRATGCCRCSSRTPRPASRSSRPAPAATTTC